MSGLITRRLAILRLGTVALAAVAVPGLTAITSAFAKDSGSSHGESSHASGDSHGGDDHGDDDDHLDISGDDDSPDRLFERRWAETVLARANQRLRREYEGADQGARFEVLKVYLLNGGEPDSYADAASKLGLTASAAKSAIYKLRQRYGEMVRHEVAQTIGDPAQVEDELRCLFAALQT